MKKTLSFWGMLIFTCSAIFAQSITPTHIYFESGSAQLSMASKEALDLFCKDHDPAGSSLLEIVGHTDDVGEDAYNIDLALKRAEQVKFYLVEQGLEGERIVLAALGESQPLASNEIESGRKQNRRVSLAMGDGTFAWLKSGSPLIYQNKEQLGILNELDVIDHNARERQFASLLNSLDVQGERFTIDPSKKEMHIQTFKGTHLYIPQGVFETEDGSNLDEPVVVEIKEYYTRSEMMLGNLNSMTPGGLLESGGMLEIQAYSGEKKLKLKESRKMEVFIPTESIKEGMGLFITETPAASPLASNFWTWDSTQNIPDSTLTYKTGEQWYINKRESKKINWEDIINHPKFLSQKSDTVWQEGVPVIIERSATMKYTRPTPISRRIFRGSRIGSRVLQNASATPDKFYIFNIGRMGLINCDRFYQDARPKTELLVKMVEDRPMVIKLMFTDLNAIMQGSYFRGTFMGFPNLPVGQKATLIAVTKGEEKGQFNFSVKPIQIAKDLRIEDLDMTAGSLEDLDKMLAESLD